MPTSTPTLLGLAASLLAGGLFLLASLRGRRAPAPEPQLEPAAIYWPLLLGTGQRTFGKAMRLEIIRQLGAQADDWRVPILICAREQERDPEMLAAVARALGTAGRPVISAPRSS